MPARFAPDLLLAVLLPLAAPALAQVSVQEYAIPRGHYAHDVWADAAPGGPVWFSALARVVSSIATSGSRSIRLSNV